MKIIITEDQLRFLNEQESRFSYDKSANKKVGNIVRKLRDILSTSSINNEEYYGIEDGKFRWFKRRIDDFIIILADNIYTVLIGEYDWWLEGDKENFIQKILINTLMNFFFDVADEEYYGEDFERNGQKEGWLYFLKDIFEDELGEVYDNVINEQ
jgi:hypothetical protein